MTTAPTTPASRVGVSLLIATLLAIATVTLILFLPVVLIGQFVAPPADADPTKKSTEMAEMGVGIAVVVRATARRLLRSGVQNMLRTTLGAFTRTAARTMTRRITRVVLRQLMGITMATVVREMSGSREVAEAKVETDTLSSSLVAIGLGFVGLLLSFRVILYLIGPMAAGKVLQGLDPWIASAIVAAPIFLHAAATWAGGVWTGTKIAYRTQVDGLLLQGYFTGATSFLPLTTDVEYRGTDKGKAQTAATVLLVLLAVHVALYLAGRLLGNPTLTFASAGLMMYCFVFSFPLPPLEGYHLWKYNKWIWAAVWLPTLIAFMLDMPDAFTAIL